MARAKRARKDFLEELIEEKRGRFDRSFLLQRGSLVPAIPEDRQKEASLVAIVQASTVTAAAVT